MTQKAIVIDDNVLPGLNDQIQKMEEKGFEVSGAMCARPNNRIAVMMVQRKQPKRGRRGQD